MKRSVSRLISGIQKASGGAIFVHPAVAVGAGAGFLALLYGILHAASMAGHP